LRCEVSKAACRAFNDAAACPYAALELSNSASETTPAFGSSDERPKSALVRPATALTCSTAAFLLVEVGLERSRIQFEPQVSPMDQRPSRKGASTRSALTRALTIALWGADRYPLYSSQPVTSRWIGWLTVTLGASTCRCSPACIQRKVPPQDYRRADLSSAARKLPAIQEDGLDLGPAWPCRPSSSADMLVVYVESNIVDKETIAMV
jgi:hypothetical protein